jgi:hypothetical protein
MSDSPDVDPSGTKGSDTSFRECPKKHKIVPALMDRAVCK